jgi:hypothetical protein
MPTNPQEDEELRNTIVDLLIEYKAADQEGRLSVYKRIIDLIHSRDQQIRIDELHKEADRFREADFKGLPPGFQTRMNELQRNSNHVH